MEQGRQSVEAHRESLAEKRWIVRFQAGEPDALDALFALHVDKVFAYARYLTGHREDAEEITSEAFVRAFTQAAQFRGEAPFRGWLFGITRNLCRDRQRQPRLLTLEPEAWERFAPTPDVADTTDTRLVIERALHELPEEQRLVLTLCDVEEWDAREVAAVLEKSLSATKSLLYRARRSLRATLMTLWEMDDEMEEPA